MEDKLTRHYRLKPREVEAVQWDGTQEQAEKIIAWVEASGGMAAFYPSSGLDYHSRPSLAISVQPRATIFAFPGSYIVRYEDGRFGYFGHGEFARDWEEGHGPVTEWRVALRTRIDGPFDGWADGTPEGPITTREQAEEVVERYNRSYGGHIRAKVVSREVTEWEDAE